MEFSFEYYDWLQKITEEPILLIFISIFGSIIATLVLALLRSLLKGIGLGFIANCSFLDDFMAVLGITGLFGGILILLFLVPLEYAYPEPNNIIGVRIVMIWLVLFITIYIFYVSNKVILKKFYIDVVMQANLKTITKKTKKT